MGGFVIGAEDGRGWCDQLIGETKTDPYYQPGYHQAFAAEQAGQAWLYCYQAGEERLVHPFILMPIEQVGDEPAPIEGCSDIESVYGYSGPMATTTDEKFLREVWSNFDGWCSTQKVVSEFIRFHTYVDGHHFAHPEMTVIEDRRTVQMAACETAEAQLAAAKPEHRNRVRRAQKAGLVFEETAVDEAALQRFLTLYQQTMHHLGSAAFYLFSLDHMMALAKGLGDRLHLFFITDGGDGVAGDLAAGLFMRSDSRLYYHLGASRVDRRADAPNDLLFHNAALWAAEQGLSALFMGGGRTNAEDDNLFRFKRKLQKDRDSDLIWHMGKRVVDAEAYKAMSESWLRQSGCAAPPQLQFYRQLL